jgi:CHAT domain-containing protein
MGLMLEVVQVPSLAVFSAFDNRNHNGWKNPRVEVFGDPVYSASDSRLPRSTASAPAPLAAGIGKRYPRLPFSQDEIAIVERLVPPERRLILRGVRASREEFLSQRTTDYSILLISAHASVDDLQPELSRIVLSQYDETGRPTDGMVRLYDLYGPTIPSFVILSACETAEGKQLDGEGLISITRGFLSAGATGLLASTFRVDDEAASVLVSRFLQNLVEHPAMTSARALLATRQTLAESGRWSDPFYWGAFTLAAAWR